MTQICAQTVPLVFSQGGCHRARSWPPARAVKEANQIDQLVSPLSLSPPRCASCVELSLHARVVVEPDVFLFFSLFLFLFLVRDANNRMDLTKMSLSGKHKHGALWYVLPCTHSLFFPFLISETFLVPQQFLVSIHFPSPPFHSTPTGCTRTRPCARCRAPTAPGPSQSART